MTARDTANAAVGAAQDAVLEREQAWMMRVMRAALLEIAKRQARVISEAGPELGKVLQSAHIGVFLGFARWAGTTAFEPAVAEHVAAETVQRLLGEVSEHNAKQVFVPESGEAS